MNESRPFRVRARGPLACFTRPEMKAERVSYEVMTPSAARGLLEAILWKPAIQWNVHSISVLAPIQWTSFRRNEVNSRASRRAADYFAEEDRAQRNTVALKDVDYLVTASFVMTDRAGPDDSVAKFVEMFRRRLEKGQHHNAPYFGCREFAADVTPASEDVKCAEECDRPLGLMLWDMDWRDGKASRGLFFDARLTNGVLSVPSREEVLRLNRGAP